MPPRMNPADRAQKLLALLGWSFGEMSHLHAGRVTWQGYAHRDSDRIVVNAPTQAAAWDEALRQVGVVQRDSAAK